MRIKRRTRPAQEGWLQRSPKKYLSAHHMPALQRLDRYPQYVLWGYRTRGGAKTKIPLRPSGRPASPIDPSTWTCLDEAVEALCSHPARFEGIGFVTTHDDPYVFVDLDKCVDPKTGRTEAWARDVVHRLDSYTEFSPSGTGLRIIVEANLPSKGRRKDKFEVYDDKRFMTITGHHIAGTPERIEKRQAEVNAIHAEIFGGTPGLEAKPIDYQSNYTGELPAVVRRAMRADRRIDNLLRHPVEELGPEYSYPSDSEVDLAIGGILSRKGVEPPDVDAALRWRRDHIDGKPKGGDYFRRTVEKAFAASDRPIILLSDNLDAVVEDIRDALVANNVPPWLLARANRTVEVRGPFAEAPRLFEVTDHTLLNTMARHAKFMREGSGGKARVAQPQERHAKLVRDLLLREDLLPPLQGIVHAPILRDDGSLIRKQGYDRETQLYLAMPSDLEVPSVPRNPVEEDIRSALKCIEDVFSDFPFCGQADYTSAVAALLSLVLRAQIQGTLPLWAVDAPAQGTGKGLLVDTVATIATSEAAYKGTAPSEQGDAEWRKRITAELRNARPLVVFDNVTEPLSSASLSALLTTEKWEDRLLGRSTTVHLSNLPLWCATGNNLMFRGDMPRRIFWSRMDAKVVKPQTRAGFRHTDLLAWVRQERGRLLGALYTLAIGWIRAGRPAPSDAVPVMGSYEAWRELVGGLLEWAGVSSFLGNLERLYEEIDDEGPRWDAFLTIWYEVFGSRPVEARTLVQHPNISNTLPEGIGDGHTELDVLATRLGRALSKRKDQRFQIIMENSIPYVLVVRRKASPGKSKRALRWAVVRKPVR